MGKQAEMKIALDTNILIYFLEGIEPQASKAEKILNRFMKTEDEGIISTITVAEVLTGFYKTGPQGNVEKIKSLLNDLTLNNFKIVPVTFEIADLAAKLRAQRGGRLPDALIVATALNQSAETLYTEDKDFQRFSREITITQLP